MGLSISKLFDQFFAMKNHRILMLGLDAAGKTTILYKLKLGEVLTSVPTIGFNVETVEYKRLKMSVWDVGGQYKIRRLWHHYYEGSSALIYVVDSSDKERIQESKEEFQYLLQSEELREAKILVYANKQDMAVMNVQEIAQEMGLYELRQKDWYIQGTCALSGDGLYDGLDWLARALKSNK